MKTPRKVKFKQSWGHYPHKNVALAKELSNLCGLFDLPETKTEHRVLQNLMYARNNYLNSKKRAPKLTSRYKNSLKRAIDKAYKLIKDMQTAPCAIVFGIHITIENYIEQECKSVLTP
ncbi:MAG: hypothetical protein CMF61_05540 [Magnetococcales bacterium]|nr:hypothetical protein [Magnetococcales bacterium]